VFIPYYQAKKQNQMEVIYAFEVRRILNVMKKKLQKKVLCLMFGASKI